jgi:hypothetical protein
VPLRGGLSRERECPIASAVLLFKRILNFKKEATTSGDKRSVLRYPVGQPFQFKAVLTLVGHDGEGQAIQGDRTGQDWAGRLVDLAESGASIQLHSAAAAHRGEPCRFRLSLDEYLLEIPGTIAHFRNYPQYALCGFSFEFADSETKQAYLQVLEPVSIGAMLAPVDPKKIKKDNTGLLKEQYQGTPRASLTVWRKAATGEIHSFDYRMHDYGARWSEGMTEVEAYGRAEITAAGRKTTPPFVHLTNAQLEEVRWLFCLSVPNLAKAVPLDVRKFLAKLVA